MLGSPHPLCLHGCHHPCTQHPCFSPLSQSHSLNPLEPHLQLERGRNNEKCIYMATFPPQDLQSRLPPPDPIPSPTWIFM